jgi:hypothetical protein
VFVFAFVLTFIVYFKNIAGHKLGRLTVTDQFRSALDNKGRPRSYWLCQCECGKEKWIMSQTLHAGKAKSCGCVAHEWFRKNIAPAPKPWKREQETTHGKTNSKVYTTWECMIQRCYNPNNISFKNYGGRGIEICPEWRKSFQAFYDAVGEPPTSKHTIDRMDNDGNYEPGNVKWSTRYEQTHNRRK